MQGFLDQESIYLILDELINRQWAVSIGISKLQGFEPIAFYLGQDQTQIPAIKFTRKSNNSPHCLVELLNFNPVWTGMPFVLKVIKYLNIETIDLGQWVNSLAKIILQQSYELIEINLDRLINDVTSHFTTVRTVSRGFQVVGYVRTGKSNEISQYSVEFVLTLAQLDSEPMIGRLADNRIAYFYDTIYLNIERPLSGEPIAIINRQNLNKIPWKYWIDPTTIPEKYHQSVKNGVLSWNNYFRYLGLGEPLIVNVANQPVNVFETDGWYICGTHIKQFNGPYSGFGTNIIDYRSGENIYGIISINILKIASHPTRFQVFEGLDIGKSSETYIQQFITWVVAHEVGHQLGLRHNFMGNLQSNSNGSIMDYLDIFTDFTHLHALNVGQTDREYDLIAIDYGYRPIEGEQTGIKQPILTQIADKLTLPMGTDENLVEEINPLVGTLENVSNPLDFVEQNLTRYQSYRQNLLHAIMNNKITSYEFNTMFIYLYTQKYPEIIDICLKYIGGRFYNKDRTHYLPVNVKFIWRSLSLLMRLLVAIEYSHEEYAYIIYNYTYDPDRQIFNRIDFKELYSMNVSNLYHLYQNMINLIFKSLLQNERLIRLNQNDPHLTPQDLLYTLTFAYSQSKHVTPITGVDGIFPELGAFLVDDPRWKDILLEMNHLKYNRQYTWLNYLIMADQHTKIYIVKYCVSSLLETIKHLITFNIMPHILRLPDSTNIPQSGIFWQNTQTKLISHWKLLANLFDKTQPDESNSITKSSKI